eukprot:scaffold335_cov68-Phaeocystis_antarctica.AAC.2
MLALLLRGAARGQPRRIAERLLSGAAPKLLPAPASRIARSRQEGGVAVGEEAVALRHRVRVQRARARRATEECRDEGHERRVWRVEVGHQAVAQRKGIARRDAQRGASVQPPARRLGARAQPRQRRGARERQPRVGGGSGGGAGGGVGSGGGGVAICHTAVCIPLAEMAKVAAVGVIEATRGGEPVERLE